VDLSQTKSLFIDMAFASLYTDNSGMDILQETRGSQSLVRSMNHLAAQGNADLSVELAMDVGPFPATYGKKLEAIATEPGSKVRALNLKDRSTPKISARHSPSFEAAVVRMIGHPNNAVERLDMDMARTTTTAGLEGILAAVTEPDCKLKSLSLFASGAVGIGPVVSALTSPNNKLKRLGVEIDAFDAASEGQLALLQRPGPPRGTGSGERGGRRMLPKDADQAGPFEPGPARGVRPAGAL
jgi:hypothetical protein